MGTRIEAVATSVPCGSGALELLIPPLRRTRRKGALALADEAAKTCLERAGCDAAEVELLINVGVFRDKNLGEPALASLIQEDIGANPGHPPGSGHGTFSFDLANGGCGIINAWQLIDRFVRSGILQLGMIVASDADPAPGKTRGFSYLAAGGAMLLKPGKEGEGFRAFHFESFPEFEYMKEARVDWQPRRTPLPVGWGGQNLLSIKEAPGYLAACVECAEIALKNFLSREQLSLQDIDLVIASQDPPEFPDVLEQHLGLPGDHIARVGESFEGALTAALIAGIEAALRSGRFRKARRILFVTVSAGIAVGLCIYEQAGTQ